MAEKIKEIRILPIATKVLKVSIEELKPLLMDKFPDEAKKMIFEKQSGIKKTGKQLRNVDKEILSAIHRLPNGKVGYPAFAFKNAMIESTSFVGDKFFSKKLIKGIQIINSVNGLIPISYKKQDVLEHSISCNTKFTPQFHNWSCELEIMFDSNNVSETDLITLLNYAGFYYGLGCWSPKNGGNFGMYQIKIKKEK